MTSAPSILSRLRTVLICAALISSPLAAADTPQSSPTVVTYNPVLLAYPAQDKSLALRITMPAEGKKLPIILFSHGAQYAKDDYLPLAEFWAAHGYVVIQPTHLESRSLAIPKDDPRLKNVWRSRVEDMRYVLDSLDTIVRLVPALKGRIDKGSILAAGHSFGGQTTSLLIGARVVEPGVDSSNLADSRIKAGVMMSPPGFGKGFLNMSWDDIHRPMLLITGDNDLTAGVNDAWQYHADPYFRSPAGTEKAPKCLAAMAGAKHYLGGILGTNRTEEVHPDPAVVQQIEDMSLAFFEESLGRRHGGFASVAHTGRHPEALSQAECK